MEKIYELLAKLGVTSNQDKVLHIIVGFLIGFIGMAIIDVWTIPLVFLAAVGKELYDEQEYGGFDFFDMFATIIGGFVGIMLMGLIL